LSQNGILSQNIVYYTWNEITIYILYLSKIITIIYGSIIFILAKHPRLRELG